MEPVLAANEPMEKLRLMEQVQGNQDWMATVVAHNNDEKAILHEVEQELRQGSYSTYHDTDLSGRDVLRVHHLGRDTGIGEGFETLGMLGGLRHTAMHVTEHMAKPVGELAGKAIDGVKYTVEDSARLLAGLYLFGDLVYANAGKNWEDPREILINMSGVAGAIQSVIYMTYARDNGEVTVEDFAKKLENTLDWGHGIHHEALWTQPEEKHTLNPITHLHHLLQKHPLVAGAGVQVAGQLGMIASGIYGLSRGETDVAGDIARACASVIAWVTLQVSEKQIAEEDKTSWKDNALKRGIEELQGAPEKYASVINTMASLFGLYSGHMKSQAAGEEQHFNMQSVAESTYLLGDMTMYFTRKANYGEASTSHIEKAGKAGADLIYQCGIMFSESTQTNFVNHIADYVAERMVRQQLGEKTFHNGGDAVHEAIKDTSTDLAKNIFRELSGKDQPIDKVAHHIASISELFPHGERAGIERDLVRTIASLPAVEINQDEMLALVERQHARFASNEYPLSPPSMSVASPLLAELTLSLPSAASITSSGTLFDVVAEHTRPSPMQEEMHHKTLQQQAAKDLGLSPHLLSALPQPNHTMSRT